MSTAVPTFAQRQPAIAWRRRLMKTVLKPIGFGLLWDVAVSGTEHIPAQGGTILMMNHISNLDPILCIGAVDHRYVVPMSKLENAQHPVKGAFLRGWGVYTIDREVLDRRALTQSIELLDAGQLILIAPEGTRHPEGLAEGKDGMTYIASKANATIVPAAISYAQGWYDSFKGFKRHTLSVNFGPAFRLKTDGRRRIPRDELAQMTRECMYQLAMTVQDENARGVYSDIENATTDCIEFV